MGGHNATNHEKLSVSSFTCIIELNDLFLNSKSYLYGGFFSFPHCMCWGSGSEGKEMAVEKALGKAGHAERSALYKKNTVDGKLFLLNFSI